MPRVEIIPEGWDESPEKARGDGTPTVDLCAGCVENCEEGDDVDDVFPASVFEGGVVGSKDVEHPTYKGGDLSCECCDEPLCAEDD